MLDASFTLRAGSDPYTQTRDESGSESKVEIGMLKSIRFGRCSLAGLDKVPVDRPQSTSSTLHIYHEATVRYGAHFAPRERTCFGVGSFRMRYAF